MTNARQPVYQKDIVTSLDRGLFNLHVRFGPFRS